MDGYEQYVQSSKEWKSAVDPKSGRTYYYHVKTKETTWNKPLELATPEERAQMIRHRQETINFFRDMESNIKQKIELAREMEEQNRLLGCYDEDQEPLYFDEREERDIQRVRFNSASSHDGRRSRLNSFSGAPQRRVRTISTLDDEILTTLRQSNGNSRHAYRPSYTAEEKRSINSFSHHVAGYKDYPSMYAAQAKHESYADDAKYDVKSSGVSSSSRKQPPKRRNSTGTIYVSSTMSSQDNSATIQCVCAVIHAHMVAAAKEGVVPLPEFDVFKDVGMGHGRSPHDNKNMALVPSLQTVKDFFTFIFSKSQLESDCIIMALIYCERLVKATKGRLCIRYDNWRSILFACLIMASKVWDDLSMWNVDFSQVFSAYDLARINALELAMLEALKYVTRVSASEYAKYYFLLRSMMLRMGLASEHALPSAAAQHLRPLDMAGARRLQLSTERYQELAFASAAPLRRRHNSLHETELPSSPDRGAASKAVQPSPVRTASMSVGLEHLIHTEHVGADGESRSLKRKNSSKSMKIKRSDAN